MMHVKVDVDYQTTLRQLRGIQREQFPFAYAMALTETARMGQTAGQVQTRQAFELHTEYIPRGIMVKNASKKELVQYGYTQSEVFTSDKITPFMAMHETGGVKKPVAGRRVIPIPGSALEQQNYQTRSGATKTKWKPRTLLQKYNASKRGIGSKGKGKRKDAFILSTGRGAFVVRRRGPERHNIEFLYVMEPSAKIATDWGLYKAVSRVANKVFRSNLEHALEQAIANSKVQ